MGADNLNITNKGFQFLLLDIHTQIWSFLLQYLEMAERMGLDMVELLGFFLQIGLLELGKGYSVRSLTPSQSSLLRDLRDLGVIYQQRKPATAAAARRFYPTRLAISLATGATTKSMVPQERNAFIVVETNYRVYAYTGGCPFRDRMSQLTDPLSPCIHRSPPSPKTKQTPHFKSPSWDSLSR